MKNTINKTRILTALMVVVVMILSFATTVIAAPVWTEVSDFAQLKKAVENKTDTHIKLTADIQMDKKGIDINGCKPTLVIDGDGFTITDAAVNGKSNTMYLNEHGTLKDITLQNVTVAGKNVFGIIAVNDLSKFKDITLTFENVTYSGPQLTWCEDSRVILRDCDLSLTAGYCGFVGELVEATHIRLEGDVNIIKNAKGPDELFRISGDCGGVLVAEDANVTVSVNMDIDKKTTSGFVHFQESGGYLIFEDNSWFSFVGNQHFQQHKDVKQLYIGKNAEVHIKTYGDYKWNYGAFMVKGDMTVEENAVLTILALNNKKGDPAIEFDKTSTLNFNNPKYVLIYNSSTNKCNRGLAIGPECADKINMVYGDIKSLEYWKLNTSPYNDLQSATFDWRNPDESRFTASCEIKSKCVKSASAVDYTGTTPFNKTTAELYNINVIRIHGGTAAVPEYLVNFDANGGVPEPAPQIIVEGNKIEKPSDPHIPHFVVEGWYTDPDFNGDPWDFDNDIVTGEVNLYAKWVYEEYCTITYLPGLGQGGSSSQEGLTSKYTIKDADSAQVSNAGFVLVSWNTRLDGLGTRYNIGTEITVLVDLYLYAQWAPAG